MAQGNILQGQAAGKLGDTVLMVRNGKQVSRVYTTSGSRSGDAASLAARLQRVRFGAASNQWQLYRYICTRMFRKGRQTKQSDYNYFVKRNVDLLPYLTKTQNADGVVCLQPGQFSEGNLGRIELLSSYAAATETAPAKLVLSDTLHTMGTGLNWSGTVGTLKTRLAQAYPNARKITYLFITASETTIEESGETFYSQFFVRSAVILDLYEEIESGENTQTLTAFFSSHVAEVNLKSIISAETSQFSGSKSLISIHTSDENLIPSLMSTAVLVFATNDLVSDTYTTILPEDAVSPSLGAYKLWATYRTAAQLAIAADSYGYQSGVMRDDISDVGADVSPLANAYMAKLERFAPEDAKEYAATLAAEKPSISTAKSTAKAKSDSQG